LQGPFVFAAGVDDSQPHLLIDPSFSRH
jgi:hypothetical protein